MEASMSSRAFVTTVSTAIAVIALPVSAARAQIRAATPAVPGSPIRTPLLMNTGGVGPFAVALTVGSTTTPYGNATNVTFQNPTPAPGSRIGAGTPGSAVVQFAPNNQMAQALERSCLAQGCLANVVITYQSPPTTTVYTLQRVKLTQFQLGGTVTATFTYPEFRTQTSSQNQNQSGTPVKATYNIEKAATS
jgi:hypothetical protein